MKDESMSTAVEILAQALESEPVGLGHLVRGDPSERRLSRRRGAGP